jgi:hypothetical protein
MFGPRMCHLILNSLFSIATGITDVAALFSLRLKTPRDHLNLHYVTCMRHDLLEAQDYLHMVQLYVVLLKSVFLANRTLSNWLYFCRPTRYTMLVMRSTALHDLTLRWLYFHASLLSPFWARWRRSYVIFTPLSFAVLRTMFVIEVEKWTLIPGHHVHRGI